MKSALITGVTGQDGSYLAELLLSYDYVVHGLVRRSSVFTTERIDHLLELQNFHLYPGDLNDASNISEIVSRVKPDEIYHLGAQSHVGVSFEVPEYTGSVSGLGTIRILSAIRSLSPHSRLYNASTSEMFGGIPGTEPQSEATAFHPRSPYGAAKLYAHWLVQNFREAYEISACNGILFNHESPRRGKTFVTRKISLGVAQWKYGSRQPIRLGNLDAVRDWGYAPDYVEAMHLMLQQELPVDLVIATGKGTTVRQFVEMAFGVIGISLYWEGLGIEEVARDRKSGEILVEVDSRYFRPAEVEVLIGDASKARSKLGWYPKTSIEKLCEIMVKSDLDQLNA